MGSTLTARRSAFRVGMVVQWHPDTNPGMDERKRNDRGRIIAITPYEDAKHIDMVMVVWDSVLTFADEDKPLSTYGKPTTSTRIRRVFFGTETV